MPEFCTIPLDVDVPGEDQLEISRCNDKVVSSVASWGDEAGMPHRSGGKNAGGWKRHAGRKAESWTGVEPS